MRYILSFLLPPLAVLLCGRPFQAIFNMVLCLFLWAPGVIHALFVVHDRHSELRLRRLLREVQRRPVVA